MRVWLFAALILAAVVSVAGLSAATHRRHPVTPEIPRETTLMPSSPSPEEEVPPYILRPY